MLDTSIRVKYPLDLSGVNPTNLVKQEYHELPLGKNRAFVTDYGAFFSESLRIIDQSTGVELIPRTQFKAVQLQEQATEKSGKEVCSIIVIVDEAVSDKVLVTYQAIGGDFSYSVDSLRTMIENLDLDSRPVAWGDLLGTPSSFPPSPHLHDAGDVYGFEYLVEAIEAIRHAIQIGNIGDIEALKTYIHSTYDEAVPKANVTETLEGLLDHLFVTPKKLKIAFDEWYELEFEKALIEINNRNSTTFVDHMTTHNPHKQNAGQLGVDHLRNQTLVTLGEALDVIDATFNEK